MLDREIKELINNARKTPLYKALYKNLGNVRNIDEVPFLEERHIRNGSLNYSPRNNESICVYFTSGTTSEPKAIYHNTREIEYITDYIKWFCSVEGIAGNERVAVLMGQSFWGVGYLTSQAHIKAGNIVTPIDTGLSKETIANLIHAFKPTVISSTPSFLLGLKDVLKNTRLKLIETTGELMGKQVRNKLEKIFNAEVFDSYGLTEGVIGTECNRHDGYHFLPNRIHLEIINPKTDMILGYGNWGELSMTVICDSIMPIIRYKTGDICKISNEKCLCGNNSPRVWIKGRKERAIPLYEGAKIGLKEFKGIISKVFGSSVIFDINVKTSERMSVLQISINDSDVEKIKLAKSKIINMNYETLYLYQTNKLHIVFKSNKTNP